MKVWIARDGLEIGAYEEQDLFDCARSGELQPIDYYWKPGMEKWEPLKALLGADPWEIVDTPSVQPLPPLAELIHQPRVLVIGAFILCVVAGIAVSFIHRGRMREEQVKQVQTTEADDQSVEAREKRLREQAIAELHKKIEKLPDASAPGSNVFYSGFHLTFTDTSSPIVPLMATISGAEEIIDPETKETLWRSNFVLEAIYRGEWTFRHYRAVTTNVKGGSTRQEENDESTPNLPMVAYNLGLKQGAVSSTPKVMSLAR
ncbi:MAG: GYF domain-containing protein [Chthoniobacterales bacterium]